MQKSKEVDLHLENDRVKVLKSYELLDTPPDASFDHLTKMAAELLEMPIAILTLVDSDRCWFKSKYGLERQEMEREISLCSTAIEQDKLYLVKNAETDKRTCANPLVTGDFNLRFYSGVPLKSKEGYNLGTLCVLDTKPRDFSQRKQKILHNLAQLVVQQIELRMEARTAIKHQNQILNITAHDLKNPLSIMPLLADLIIDNKNNPKAIADIAKQIKSAGRRMNKTIENLLESAREDMGRIQLRLKPLDFSRLIKGVTASNLSLARKKQQILKLDLPKSLPVFADHRRLTEIVDNLINNAIKFSPKGKSIYISLREEGNMGVFEVRDEGPGLSKDDIKHLFRKFTSLSALPTGGESSTGLGLSIVKQLVNAHRGKVYAKSEGAGKGSAFVVEIPLSEDSLTQSSS